MLNSWGPNWKKDLRCDVRGFRVSCLFEFTAKRKQAVWFLFVHLLVRWWVLWLYSLFYFILFYFLLLYWHFYEAFVGWGRLLDLKKLCCEYSRLVADHLLAFQHYHVTPADYFGWESLLNGQGLSCHTPVFSFWVCPHLCGSKHEQECV